LLAEIAMEREREREERSRDSVVSSIYFVGTC